MARPTPEPPDFPHRSPTAAELNVEALLLRSIHQFQISAAVFSKTASNRRAERRCRRPCRRACPCTLDCSCSRHHTPRRGRPRCCRRLCDKCKSTCHRRSPSMSGLACGVPRPPSKHGGWACRFHNRSARWHCKTCRTDHNFERRCSGRHTCCRSKLGSSLSRYCRRHCNCWRRCSDPYMCSRSRPDSCLGTHCYNHCSC